MSDASTFSHPENFERLPEPVQRRLQVMAVNAEAATHRLNADLTLAFRTQASKTLTGIMKGRIRRQQAILALWDLADQIGRAAASHAACKRGCSHCCHIPVALSRREAELIGRRIGQPPKPAATTIELASKPYGYQHPCPFLVDGQCSIYAHRPFSCRAHFNLDVDDLLCVLIPDEVVPVPYLNVTQLQTAYVAANPEGLGDIRDFFSPGAPQ